jgi:hypothetical protein
VAWLAVSAATAGLLAGCASATSPQQHALGALARAIPLVHPVPLMLLVLISLGQDIAPNDMDVAFMSL